MFGTRRGPPDGCRVIHEIPGRIRIRWPGLKHLGSFAGDICRQVEDIEGVTYASPNCVTGNVLVLFDPARIDRNGVLEAVEIILGSHLPLARRAERERLALETVQERRLQEEPVGRMAARLLVTSITMVLSRPGQDRGGSLDRWYGRLLSLPGLTALSLARPIFASGLRSVLDDRRPNADTLTSCALLVSVLTGRGLSALMILWLSDAAELMTAYTMGRTRKAIQDMLSVGEPTVQRLRPDGSEESVPVRALAAGDRVLALTGQKISVDGTVLSGDAAVDQSSITGEFMPAGRSAGDRVFAGTVVQSGRLVVRADRVGDETAVARILHQVEEAAHRKAGVQSIADRLSAGFLPVNFLLAGAIYAFTRDSNRALNMLIVDFSCGVRLSTATALSAAIYAAARRGILIKGSLELEQLGEVDTVVFDKTGTLTEGRPRISSILPIAGHCDERGLVELAAAAEASTPHPLAQAVLDTIRRRGWRVPAHDGTRIHPARGVSTRVDGRLIRVGNRRFMEEERIDAQGADDAARRLVRSGETPLYVAGDDAVLGLIGVTDVLRPDMRKAINRLRRHGIDDVILLTGDLKRQAEAVAARMSVDSFEAEALPEDKAQAILRLRSRGARVAMVGDGVNDAPALAYADVGIATGETRTDIAMEVAAITVAGTDPLLIPALFELADRTMGIVRQNFAISIGVNAAAMVLGSMGILPVFASAVIHNACTVAVVFNSSRLLFHDVVRNR